MNRCLCAVLILLPLVAGAAKPRSVALTIQDNGRIQVSETHDLEPAGPDGLVRIGPLPETLLPASVAANPIERGESLDILAQRFAYDLKDNAALFQANRGNVLTCRQGATAFSGRLAATPDFASPTPSLLLEAENQPGRLVPNLYALDSIEFAPRPELARMPTLLWQLPQGQTPPAAVQLQYAASGLPWSAFHEAILADDARSIALSTRIRLLNQTGREFPAARIRLALTDKGQFAPLVPAPGDLRLNQAPGLRYSADGKNWIPERAAASAAIIETYDLPKPLALPEDAEVYATLCQAPSLAVETRYVYDGVRFDRFQRNRRTDGNLGTEFSSAVETRLTLRNDKTTALPPGEFRLLRGQADQPLDWIGSAWLSPLPRGGTATLPLGPAAGLTGTRLRTAYVETVPLKVAEESFEITLDNQTAADRDITVIEHFYRGENHEITAASAEHVPGDDPHSVRFDIPVKAGTQKSFTYTVRYTW